MKGPVPIGLVNSSEPTLATSSAGKIAFGFIARRARKLATFEVSVILTVVSSTLSMLWTFSRLHL